MKYIIKNNSSVLPIAILGINIEPGREGEIELTVGELRELNKMSQVVSGQVVVTRADKDDVLDPMLQSVTPSKPKIEDHPMVIPEGLTNPEVSSTDPELEGLEPVFEDNTSDSTSESSESNEASNSPSDSKTTKRKRKTKE